MNIEFIEFSSPGLVRPQNQDSIFSAVNNNFGLFAVADGMGGHSNGEIASQRLTDRLKCWWDSFCTELYDFDKCYDDLRNVINDVHTSIFEEFTEKGTTCGTTIALVFIYQDRYIIINSGDSRIYSKNGLKVKQESQDHVFGVESVISGRMTPDEADKHPNKNKLTAAIGCKKELKMYIASAPLNTDQFFICSDGVYKYCKNSDINAAMRKKDIVSYVSDIVNKNGASDNFSFISVKITDNKMKAFAVKKEYIAAAVCSAVLICIIAAVSNLPKNKDIEISSDSSENTTTQSETTSVTHNSIVITQAVATDIAAAEISDPPNEDDEITKEIENAYEALSNKEYETAEEIFRNIADKNSSNIDAYIGLALSYIGLGEKEESQNALIEYAGKNNIPITVPDDLPDEIPPEEIPTEEVLPEEVPTQEVPTQEVPTQEVPTQEVPTQEVPTQEVPTE